MLTHNALEPGEITSKEIYRLTTFRRDMVSLCRLTSVIAGSMWVTRLHCMQLVLGLCTTLALAYVGSSNVFG